MRGRNMYVEQSNKNLLCYFKKEKMTKIQILLIDKLESSEITQASHYKK